MFYGVNLSAVDTEGNADADTGAVVTSKDEALRMLKTHKGARFKAFESLEEAESFAKERNADSRKQEKGESKNNDDGGSDDSATAAAAATTAAPEGCPWPSLTPQELKRLKEAILAGDESSVLSLVSSNPRYLTTPCDTPAIVHSGTRGNALHIASGAGVHNQSLHMARVVLGLIQDPDLMSRMYPGESAELRSRRQERLLDLFLNMPNKGHHDTPLHQACKFGNLDVVRLLASFSSCDVLRRNRQGLTPADVACSRQHENDEELKKEIRKALEGQVYIPLFRDVDTNTAFIGEPWTPGKENNNDVVISNMVNPASPTPTPLSPLAASTPRPKLKQMEKNNNTSPLLLASKKKDRSNSSDTSVLSSPLTVRALLGPLSPGDAICAREEWRQCGGAGDAAAHARRRKPSERALQTSGRGLAKKFAGSNLWEYWDFLDAYCDVTSEDGLRLLDNHLNDVSALEVEADASESFQEGKKSQKDEAEEVVKQDVVLSPVSELIKGFAKLHVREFDTSSSSSYDSCENLANDQSDSYWTAEEDEDEVEICHQVYLAGVDAPSEADVRLFDALRENAIDPVKFPQVAKWKRLVAAADDEERSSWKGTNTRQKLLKVPKLDMADFNATTASD